MPVAEKVRGEEEEEDEDFPGNNLLIDHLFSSPPGITPVEGTEETVRVVSMDKDFHVDCYICEECGMQLTDEPDKRCYPFEGRLMCRPCHIQKMQPHHILVAEPVSASYQYLG